VDAGDTGSKTSHQQNRPFLNWRCRLTQADLYNGRKKVVGWLVLAPLVDVLTCSRYIFCMTALTGQRTRIVLYCVVVFLFASYAQEVEVINNVQELLRKTIKQAELQIQ